MRDFVIRCRFAVCLFLMASSLIVTDASVEEPETFRHLLTLAGWAGWPGSTS